MRQLDYPFIVKLMNSYRDQHNLHLLTEFVPGGELFAHLDDEGSFRDPVAQFYASNILLALEHMHKHDFIYSDLKPENCMIDRLVSALSGSKPIVSHRLIIVSPYGLGLAVSHRLSGTELR